jgi:hypothetical protein
MPSSSKLITEFSSVTVLTHRLHRHRFSPDWCCTVTAGRWKHWMIRQCSLRDRHSLEHHRSVNHSDNHIGVQLDIGTPTFSNYMLLFIFVKEESVSSASICLSWQQNEFSQYGTFNNNANYKDIFRLRWCVWSYYIWASLHKPRPTL